jgi:hypothetical protein
MIFGIFCVLIISLIQTTLAVVNSIPVPVVIGTIFLFVNKQITVNSGAPTRAETLKAVVAGVWALLIVSPSSVDEILLRLCLGITGIAASVILALELEVIISCLLDRPSLKYMLLLGDADLPSFNVVNKNATIIHVITKPVGAGSKKRSFFVGTKNGDLFWYSFFGSNHVTRKVAGCPSYDIERLRPASDFKMIVTLESIVEEVEEEEAYDIEDGDTYLVDEDGGIDDAPSVSEPDATPVEASLLSLNATDPISAPVRRRSARLAGKRAAALLDQVSDNADEHSSCSVFGSTVISGRRRSARLVSRTSCMNRV